MADKVVILGGAGFIGQNLQAELSRRGVTPYVFDKVYPHQNLLDGRDLLKLKNMLQELGRKQERIPIFMLAANVGAIEFNSSPIALADQNYMIDVETLNMLQAVQNAKFSVVYASTSEVYDECAEDGSHRIIVSPARGGRSLYSQVKLVGETKLLHIRKQSSCISSAAICRLFNVSGKHQRRGVVYGMVKSAIDAHAIYYMADTTREITFVQDAVRQLADCGLNGIDGTFDVTSKQRVTLADLAACVKAALVKIDPMFNDVKLHKLIADKFSRNRGTVPVMKTQAELDEFTRKLVEHNTVKDIFMALKRK